MRLILAMAVAVPLALIAQSPLLSAGENYALLVGVGDYQVRELRPLKYTRADVLALHGKLLESGFRAENIVLMHDDLKRLVAHYEELGPQYRPLDYVPRADNIQRELKLLLGRLRPEDSVVVAFSGHGVQFRGEKSSYFCPAGAELTKKDSLISFDAVFAALKDSEASRRLFLVDACQNDPLTSLAKSRQTVDLESTTRPQSATIPQGIIALFSCRSGQKSYEMPELGHGVFFHHLLEAWDGKGDLDADGKLSYQELAAYTQRETAEYAAVHLKVLQTPQLKAEFSGEWVLRDLPKLPPLFNFADQPRNGDEAQAAQAAWAKALGLKTVETNSLGMKLTLIPPGEYLMGSAAGETGRDEDEFQHRVRITKAFHFGTTEVTQAQWKSLMGTEPWKGQEYVVEGDDVPATYVDWDEAQEFCRRLSAREGATYRLPSEAEWEYACRAGTQTAYFFGDDASRLVDHAWFEDNAETAGELYAHAVSRKKPNPWGLYDISGNVWEMCRDWYDGKYFAESGTGTAIDPQGPSKELTDRSIRGGSWSGDANASRSAYRNFESPDVGGYFLGFRVVRVLRDGSLK